MVYTGPGFAFTDDTCDEKIQSPNEDIDVPFVDDFDQLMKAFIIEKMKPTK